MVCCVVVAFLFALPFIIARGIYCLLAGSSNCSMAWRPLVVSPLRADSLTASTDQQTSGPALRFTVTDRLKSFGHAGRGAFRLLRFEHSAWIQMTIAAATILIAVVLDISAADWRWIVIASGLVLSIEGLNTAVESTCDRISLAYSEQIKIAKDVAAGAVLLSSITAALIGLLTFWPYMVHPQTGLLKNPPPSGSDSSRVIPSTWLFNPEDFLCQNKGSIHRTRSIG